MRPKLSIPAQIKDMKEAGIKFDVMSETEASRYLDTRTYYFRIKAYAKNYDKYRDTEKQGQYINLDFAYLVDLAEIDACLKKIILEMALDLEHFLKVKLLSDFNMVDEDGYEIVEELFKMQPSLHDSIEEKLRSPHCSDLVNKYKDQWAIWNIVEVMSLGQLSNLYSLFYRRNKFKDSYVAYLLPMNMIRNAAAHDNCLLHKLRPPFPSTVSPNRELRHELSQIGSISKNTLQMRLEQPAINDFSSLLYLYYRIVPPSVRGESTMILNKLFYSRMLKNSDYYSKNEQITHSYDFMIKILDYYIDKGPEIV